MGEWAGSALVPSRGVRRARRTRPGRVAAASVAARAARAATTAAARTEYGTRTRTSTLLHKSILFVFEFCIEHMQIVHIGEYVCSSICIYWTACSLLVRINAATKYSQQLQTKCTSLGG